MNTLQKAGLTLGVVVSLVFSVYCLNRVGQTVVQQVAPSLGAVPTLDAVDNPYTSIGGRKRFYWNVPITATSSVICAVKNPYGKATTTVDNVAVNITGGILGANKFDISTTSNTSGYGSSTPAFVAGRPVPSTALASFGFNPGQSTTTHSLSPTTRDIILPSIDGQGGFTNILGPDEWLSVRISTTSPGTFSTYYSGTCSGEFTKL